VSDVARTISIRDEAAGLCGWIVIDSAVRGESGGGLRMTPTVDEEELGLLARTMTLKYGYLGFPKGGAKAGIRFDPESSPEKARELLGLFGRGARPLLAARSYLPGPDMGTDEAAIRHLLLEGGLPSRGNNLWPWADSGRFTATGLAASFFAAARRLSIPERRLTVLLEGLGSVGLSVARILVRRGVRIVAAANRHGRIYLPEGIDPERWSAFVAAEGADRIALFPGARSVPKEEFLAIQADAFLPCAAIHAVTGATASLLRVRIVAPGANNPLTPDARAALERRNVLVLPDFVANGGGVLGGALAFGGLRPDRVEEMVHDTLARATEALLDEADARGVSPVDLAEKAARARFERTGGALASTVALTAVALRRKHFIPKWIGRVMAEAYAGRLAKKMSVFD
jgi:glutamate dehydrogenase (NAD(P)+)